MEIGLLVYVGLFLVWWCCGWAGTRILKWVFWLHFDKWDEQDQRFAIVYSFFGPISLIGAPIFAWMSTGRVGWRW